MDRVAEFVRGVLGVELDSGVVDILQAGGRSIVIYLAMVVLVRLGNKRFMSQSTAFDTILAIVLGSIMSRAVNSGAPLLPTIGASAVLVLVHWIFSYISYRTGWFGNLVKGKAVALVEHGEPRHAGLRGSAITENDLVEAARLQLNHSDLSRVEHAYLERNGRISFIERDREPKVLEVSVEKGVKTVRIRLE